MAAGSGGTEDERKRQERICKDAPPMEVPIEPDFPW